ncbi:MAG: PA14 domain-containing protein, partial [Candidatus Marinimicrobia bacterium]|nr:PA14 domain-containing protein [Candidatus Neomarinimicrobiota bacterium]
ISTFAFAQRASGSRVPLDPNWIPLSHEEKMLLIEQSTPTINSGNIMSNSARQGGDTFADAVAITFPYNGSGTTVGYENDYGPFDDNANILCDPNSSPSWGLASDVVYKLTLTESMNIVVNLDGSNYDTALGVYDSSNTALVLANDDYNNVQSYVQCDLPPGTYYIVVDGYMSDEGNYEIAVYEHFPPEEFAYIEVSEEEAGPGENVSVAVSVDADGYMVGRGSFTGQYYQGNPGTSPDFGELVLTREDPVIDFYWEQNSPDPSMEADHFQVRWTGDVLAPVDGNYQFQTYSDDGVRLMVDGDTLINQWDDYGGANFYANVTLEEGYHEVVLEYYENGGWAYIHLWWTPPQGFQDLVHPEGEERVLNAAEFQFAGFQNHPVDFTGISLDPSFDGWSMDFNNTDSVLYVAMAGANGVHMSELGTLFTLDFQVNENVPQGVVPVNVVQGVLNAHSPYWEIEQGSIWIMNSDLNPTSFNLLSPENDYTLTIDQSNLNQSTTFSWEESTDPEGNDVSYSLIFYPIINLPDGTEYYPGPVLDFLGSTSASISNQNIVAALSAAGASTGWTDWQVVASDGELFPALAFDGGYIEVPNSDNLNFGTADFTISLWFEHYGWWDSLQVSQQLLVKHNVDSDRYELQLNRMDDGMVLLTAYVGDDVMSASRAFDTNHLYHIVLSRSSGIVSMYMDGENVGEMISAGNTTSDESLYLGVDPFYGEDLHGTMTDVTMYSTGLTNESITTLFEDGPQSDINISEATSMVAHWSMIDGINQFADEERVLADISGNSNNGMMYEYVYYWGVTNGKYTWSSNWRTFNIDAYGVLSVNDNNMPIQFA